MSPYTKIIYFLMAWATFCILMASHLESADWRSDFHGRNNESCCGEEDCWPVFARVITEKGDLVDIEVDGMLIRDFPRNSLHASQDNQDWACHPMYYNLEHDEQAKDALGNAFMDGMDLCGKKTKNPNCINCIFITPGA